MGGSLRAEGLESRAATQRRWRGGSSPDGMVSSQPRGLPGYSAGGDLLTSFWPKETEQETMPAWESPQALPIGWHEQGEPRAAAPQPPRCGRLWTRWCFGTSTHALWCWPGAAPGLPGSRGSHAYPRTPAPERPPPCILGEEATVSGDRSRGRVGPGVPLDWGSAALGTGEPQGPGQQQAARLHDASARRAHGPSPPQGSPEPYLWREHVG